MADTTTLSDRELGEILGHCDLFNSLSTSDRELLAGRCVVRRVSAGELMFAEGHSGDEMYVLIDGVLDVFKQVRGKEVMVQRIDEVGAHFGERALLDSGSGVRRMSVRCINASNLLVLPKDVLMQALQLSPAIEKRIGVLHHRQTKQLSFVERSVMYRALAMFDQQHGWSREEHFEPGQVIVAEGDPPSAVYVVRSGSVKRSRVEDGEEVVLSMLHEGQTFGGHAMMQDRPHSAAAIAESVVELVTFDREQFLYVATTVPELHDYLGAVKRVYAMSGGLVTLFDGEFRGQPALVTVVRLDDDREVIVNHVIDRAIYSASIEISPEAECEEFIYRDNQREILRILTVHDSELVRVHVEGPWEELNRVHALLLQRVPVEDEALQQFGDNGHLLEPSSSQLAKGPEAILCQCLGLTRATIESALVHGAETLEDLRRETGATTICGTCTATIASLVSSSGQPVKLCEEIEVTPAVRSYRFMPCADTDRDDEIDPEPLRPALPGQHVVISAEIDGTWVHRPYTITSPARCTEWREITVKREDHGFLSNWLFKQPQNPRLKMSHPKGDVWVDPDLRESVVCLVAGIGVTPALAIARGIDEVHSDQTLHIDYSVLTEIGVAYRSELDELAARNDNINVNYRATGGIQLLDLAPIEALHARLPGARYIVCGPQGYMDAAERLLLEVGVRSTRIQLEAFTLDSRLPLDSEPERSLSQQLQLGATLTLCVFYLIQHAFGWSLSGLIALQSIDFYRIISGSALITFIGYQWYLPYLKLKGLPAQAASDRHRYLGVIAPVLLYLHSVSLGFAYTFVLGILFVFNTAVGALDKDLIADVERRQSFLRIWLLIHIPLACLVSVLALIHMVYALAYK